MKTRWYVVIILMITILSVSIVLYSNIRYNKYIETWHNSEWLIIEEVTSYKVTDRGYEVCLDQCYLVHEIYYDKHRKNGIYLELRKRPSLNRQNFLFSNEKIYDIRLVVSTMDL